MLFEGQASGFYGANFEIGDVVFVGCGDFEFFDDGFLGLAPGVVVNSPFDFGVLAGQGSEEFPGVDSAATE